MAKMKKSATKKMAAPSKRGRKPAVKGAGKKMSQSLDTFELHDGVPLGMLRTSPQEQERIRNTFKNLPINSQHFVVPVRMKSAVKKIANTEFPEYHIRTLVNKAKGTISVWRDK